MNGLWRRSFPEVVSDGNQALDCEDSTTKPLAIDLYAGLGGWTEGLQAEGYGVVGFDNERHAYGEARYPAQLVIQDVLTLHGSQFRNAALIVASPPCQEFSYMAMPWTRAKEKAAALCDGRDDPKRLTALFDACFRIQREACEAAGRHIPLVVENVCGAQAWVGRARWHYGSFYLWGDVPALMPITRRSLFEDGTAKVGGFSWGDFGKPGYKAQAFNGQADRNLRDESRKLGAATSGHGQNPDGRKTVGHVNKRDGHGHTRHLTNQAEHDGVKHGGDCFNDPTWPGKQGGVKGSQGYERNHPQAFGWKKPGTSSHSTARKAASAHIAKIPYELARHIGRAWMPERAQGRRSELETEQ